MASREGCSRPTLNLRDSSLGDLTPNDVFKMVEKGLKGETKLTPDDMRKLLTLLNDVRIDPRSKPEEKKKALDYMEEVEYRFTLYSNQSYAENIPKQLVFDEANRDAVTKVDILSLLKESDVKINTDNVLGQGSFGTVFLGTKDGLPVAIKVLNADASEDDDIAFHNEAQILARMRHPFCCEYIGYMESPFRIVTRRYPTTLYDVVMDGTLTLAERFQIAYQLTSALAYIHSIGLLHRDLKSENVFIDENKNVRVADFGLTEYAPGVVQDDGSPPGSLLFMSPEQVLGKPFSYKCEVFTLGMMFHELFTGRLPFSDLQTKEQLIACQKAIPMLPVYEKDYSTKRGDGKPPREMFDLAAKCYSYLPENRPELNTVMKNIVDIAVKHFIPKSTTAGRFWKSICTFTFRKNVLISEFIRYMNVEPRYNIADTLTKAVPSAWELMDISHFWNLCCWFPNFFYKRDSFALMEEVVHSDWYAADDRVANLRLNAAKENAFVIRPSTSDPYHEPFVLACRVVKENHYSHIVRHFSSKYPTFSCNYIGDKEFTSLQMMVKYIRNELSFAVAPKIDENLRSVYE